MGGSAPKPPPPTAQELAMERRTEKRLDEEIGLSERRLKAQARKQLGAQSLLAMPVEKKEVKIKSIQELKESKKSRDMANMSRFARRLHRGITGMVK
jgi:hypothetical protein